MLALMRAAGYQAGMHPRMGSFPRSAGQFHNLLCCRKALPYSPPMPITESTSPHGYSWRYDHSAHEPEETFEMACRVASCVAGDEARKCGHAYVVATTLSPRAIYVFAKNDSELMTLAMEILYEITPEGECIKRGESKRH